MVRSTCFVFFTPIMCNIFFSQNFTNVYGLWRCIYEIFRLNFLILQNMFFSQNMFFFSIGSICFGAELNFQFLCLKIDTPYVSSTVAVGDALPLQLKGPAAAGPTLNNHDDRASE
jgi:hypothetical protein